MAAAVIGIFIWSIAAPVLERAAKRWAGVLLALGPLAALAAFAVAGGSVIRGDVLRETSAWVPGLGLDAAFRLDGLSWLFALLITGVGTLVVLYAGSYLKGHAQLGRFYLYLLAFMGSMLGLVLADNLLLLFIFWELTSITSYLLIGFDHHREEARKSALMALLVTGLGGLALLGGVLMLGNAAGTYTISEVLLRGDAIKASPLYTPAVILILLGCFTKSAQFPFHFWLPKAMEAPTPVSAYLHSSTMVKAGIYLLARLDAPLSGEPLWKWSLVVAGTITALLGAYMASRHSYFKKILAYTTISALGTLTMLIGMGTDLALQAAVVYLLAHAMYKGSLFLVAGAVDHATGIKDVEKLGGLSRPLPLIGLAAALAALSMAGVPPFFGFIGKELILKAKTAGDDSSMILLGASLLTGAFTAVAALLAGFRPFFGKFKGGSEGGRVEVHKPDWAITLGPVVLALGGAVIGFLPGPMGEPLVAPTAAAIAGREVDVTVAIWDYLKIGPVLALSLGAVAAGLVLYRFRDGWRRATGVLAPVERIGPEVWYGGIMRGVLGFAAVQTRLIQNGRLRVYLVCVLLASLLLAAYAAIGKTPRLPRHALEDIGFFEVTLLAMTVVGAIAAATVASRLAAVAALGVVGFAVATMFLFLGAPDLAMTQFVIETLTVLIFVLLLYQLPRFQIYSGRAVRAMDVVLASLFGGVMGTLAFVASGSSSKEPISAFFAEKSVTEAYGRNLINVILVDFRALDTLGEITVLVTAAIGVMALLKLRGVKDAAAAGGGAGKEGA